MNYNFHKWSRTLRPSKLVEEWNNITQDFVDHLIRDMHRRVNALLQIIGRNMRKVR